MIDVAELGVNSDTPAQAEGHNDHDKSESQYSDGMRQHCESGTCDVDEQGSKTDTPAHAEGPPWP